MADNRNDQRHGATAEVPSLLAGLLRDSNGEQLAVSHASKGNRRYRYYVSRSLLTSARQDAPDGLRLPAADIESVVETRLIDLLSSPGELHQVIGSHVADASQLEHLNSKAKTLAPGWRQLEMSRRRALLLAIHAGVTVHRDGVDIRVAPLGLIAALASWPKAVKRGALHSSSAETDAEVILTVPATLRRSGIGKRTVIAGATASEPDPALIKLLIKAREIREAVLAGRGATLEAIAGHRGITSSYATRLLRLSFLSPDLVKMILDGHQPPTLTARRLLADTRLPIVWNDQLAALS